MSCLLDPAPLPLRRLIVAGALAAMPLPATAAAELPVLPPQLDPAKVVNASLQFLREREPEMTEVEHALYTRMIPIVEQSPELALELLETMLADDKPESAAFEFVLGNVYFTLQRMDGAEQHFRRALDRYPDFLRAWVNLGSVYYATGRYRDAIPCFAKAVALGDREASTFGLLASSLRESGNPFAAESAYKQAMTSEPENPDWINGLLEIYLKTEQHAPAAALARELVQAQPAEPRHWTLYSGLLVILGRRTEAMAVLQLGGELDALTPASWHVLGDLYAEARLPREAAAAYGRAATDPAAGPVWGYVRSLLQEGRLADAEHALAAWPEPEDPVSQVPLRRARAELALARGDAATAQRELEAALRLQPLEAQSLLALAALHRDRDDVATATWYYEQALHQPDAAFTAHVELAQLALRDQAYGPAIEHVRHALALRSSDELQDFLTRLQTLAGLTDRVPSTRTGTTTPP